MDTVTRGQQLYIILGFANTADAMWVQLFAAVCEETNCHYDLGSKSILKKYKYLFSSRSSPLQVGGVQFLQAPDPCCHLMLYNKYPSSLYLREAYTF